MSSARAPGREVYTVPCWDGRFVFTVETSSGGREYTTLARERHDSAGRVVQRTHVTVPVALLRGVTRGLIELQRATGRDPMADAPDPADMGARRDG